MAHCIHHDPCRNYAVVVFHYALGNAGIYHALHLGSSPRHRVIALADLHEDFLISIVKTACRRCKHACRILDTGKAGKLKCRVYRYGVKHSGSAHPAAVRHKCIYIRSVSVVRKTGFDFSQGIVSVKHIRCADDCADLVIVAEKYYASVVPKLRLCTAWLNKERILLLRASDVAYNNAFFKRSSDKVVFQRCTVAYIFIGNTAVRLVCGHEIGIELLGGIRNSVLICVIRAYNVTQLVNSLRRLLIYTDFRR